MNQTDLDHENAQFLKDRLGLKYRAEAVGRAMSMLRYVAEKLLAEKDVQLAFVYPDGRCDRIVMPELEQMRTRGHVPTGQDQAAEDGTRSSKTDQVSSADT